MSAPGGTAPLPRVLVAASGGATCGTTLTAALLAVSTAALGRELLCVDATGTSTLRALVGAPGERSPAAVSPTLTVADASGAELAPLLSAAAAPTRATLIDAGARLGPVLGALGAARAAGGAPPGLLVVTGTAPAQLAAAYALVKVAAERGLTGSAEVIVVGGEPAEARDAFALLAEGTRHFLRQQPLARPLAFAAHVPEDPSLAVALAAGMRVHDAAAGSPAALALAPLAHRWADAPFDVAAPVPSPAGRPSPLRSPAPLLAAAATALRRPTLAGPSAYAAAPAR